MRAIAIRTVLQTSYSPGHGSDVGVRPSTPPERSQHEWTSVGGGTCPVPGQQAIDANRNRSTHQTAVWTECTVLRRANHRFRRFPVADVTFVSVRCARPRSNLPEQSRPTGRRVRGDEMSDYEQTRA